MFLKQHHLTQPDQGFISVSSYQLNIQLTLEETFLPLILKQCDYYFTNFLYQKQQDFQQFNYGVYVNRGPIVEDCGHETVWKFWFIYTYVWFSSRHLNLDIVMILPLVI